MWGWRDHGEKKGKEGGAERRGWSFTGVRRDLALESAAARVHRLTLLLRNVGTNMIGQKRCVGIECKLAVGLVSSRKS